MCMVPFMYGLIHLFSQALLRKISVVADSALKRQQGQWKNRQIQQVGVDTIPECHSRPGA